MKTYTLISWNVNGIRAVLKKNFFSFLETHDPDILCLQETKAQKEQVEAEFPKYFTSWNSAEKKGYSGTAVFSKEQPLQSESTFLPETPDQNFLDSENRDANTEGRIITTEFEKFFVVNVYTPNSKDDLSRIPLRYHQWDKAFLEHLLKLEKIKPVIAVGDFNVAHREIDLARPKENMGKKGFTSEERERFGDYLHSGFIDSFRHIHGDTPGAYTWWSHWGNARANNTGWRIDYCLVSPKLKDHIKDAFILQEVFGSDHCPVGIKLSI